MPLDRNQMRNDLPFLRRRAKRPESVSNATSSVQTTTGGLNLVRPSASSGSASGRPSTGNQPPSPQSSGRISFDRPGRATNTSPTPAVAPSASGGLSLSRPSSSATSAPSVGSGLSLGRPSSSAPSAGGLSLGVQTGSTAAVHPAKKHSTRSSLSLRPQMDADLPKHSVPYFRNNTELSLESPVVRLDFRQSGIGSLVIKGAQAFAWETTDMQGGLQVCVAANSSAVAPPSFGNRKLAEFVGDDVIIGLRHAANLRRIVVASQVNDLKLTMYDGSVIYMPSDGGKNVMLISRVGHELEVRLEKVDSIDICEVFSIKVSNVTLDR